MKLKLLAATGVLIFVVSPPVQANAEVSSKCLSHLAELPPGQKTTAAGDRRYHLARGEESPCTEQDAQEFDSKSTYSSKAESSRDESKSRYCRKRWYC